VVMVLVFSLAELEVVELGLEVKKMERMVIWMMFVRLLAEVLVDMVKHV